MSALEGFLKAPAESSLVALNKEQLLKLAEHYKIELPSAIISAKKKQLVDFIREFLKEQNVLPLGTPSDSQVQLVAEVPQPVKTSMLTFDQQKQLLELEMEKKLEFEQKRFDLEQKAKEVELAQKAKDRCLN